MSTFALGRIKNHDPASRGFPAVVSPRLVTTHHQHAGPVLNQGQLGSCTANAICQALNTDPLFAARQVTANPVDGKTHPRLLTEDDAVSVYSAATKVDNIAGVYPPTDSGSSGLAVSKVMRSRGVIHSYRHTFSLKATLAALVLQPVIVGIPWLEGMFEPVNGRLALDGPVVGGHEVALIGIDVERQVVTVLNSWGPGWATNGTAELGWADLSQLLAQDGDCTVPVVAT